MTYSQKAVLVGGDARYQVIDAPFPEQADEGTVVVEISRVGVCGSDVAAFKDGKPYTPYLSGHEWAGRIISVGKNVTLLKAGDRVLNCTPKACQECDTCVAGHGGRCERAHLLSMGTHPHQPPHGAYAKRIQIPAEKVMRIPDELTDEQAAMVEPATVALHGVRRKPVGLGDVAVVLGGGPVGLFAVQFLKLSGAKVLLVEPVDSRRALGDALGADGSVHPDDAESAVGAFSNGLGADLVVDCAGLAATLEAGPLLSRSGGTVVLVSTPLKPVTINPGIWLGREVSLMASLAHLNPEFYVTIELMISGRLQTAPLIDKTVGLGGLQDALAQLASGGAVKILIDPSLES
ncbi:zinc-dependent alcohol dehydrogenase [Herbiconiux ginsengi]|uniref:(R,R)-butanediol dehydrogenase / meso-butanediol dehydrogenase / diacetyl reductase/L-iditol 2-dehydrogenase n=1 Tax=Herbiconiux ginsengi TaxID=381665 RepID=A0A1H3TCU3_9MICO|nr:alcohol dehydrogenase catalytic domain-containing protein [Herbiconiux ginsengi]SDZ48123.1 (R,R)-butanediol dehydrogenase / meso-butanediol dehydrogenase / diacetyl reductase/L-iditol 2-dehydrogenase [Herbiconiux ginsengi]